MRIAFEPRPGKPHALEHGLCAARYEFLGIVDDDNWLREDWVQIAYTQMLAHPEAGILGSSSSPVFQGGEPPWFSQVEVMYAITPRAWQTGDFTRPPHTIWGAGMVVRKSAWLGVRELDPPRLIAGRLKKSLSGGEDDELCHQLRLAGWKLRWEPKLHFQHFLPEGRLNWEYARRLFYGGGEAQARLHPYALSLYGMDNPRQPSYKSSWLWAVFMIARDLLRNPGAPLRAALPPSEGNQAVLALASLSGRISMFLRLRRTYTSKLREVREFAQRVRGQAEDAGREAQAVSRTPELSPQ